MSPSFCICRRTPDNDDCGIAPFFCHAFATSLFFILRLTSTLYSLEALRCKTGHTRRAPRLLPCLARWGFILRMRFACFPPRGDDIAPTVCPYLITALNGSSQQCFRCCTLCERLLLLCGVCLSYDLTHFIRIDLFGYYGLLCAFGGLRQTLKCAPPFTLVTPCAFLRSCRALMPFTAFSVLI